MKRAFNKYLVVFNDSDPLKKGLLIFFALMLGVHSAQALETVTYYHHDALGSPVAATNAEGDLLWREDYMPYGERVRNPANAGDNTLWYTSKPEEPALGLQYFGARWYDPSLGRFTGMDPVKFQEGNIHSFNRYAYANNNPFKYLDPDGKEAVELNLIGVGVTFGRDASTKKNVPFFTYRLGVVGTGIMVYEDYYFSRSEKTSNVVGYKSDGAAMKATKENIELDIGFSASVGIISADLNLANGYEEFTWLHYPNGKVGEPDVKKQDIQLDPRIYYSFVWDEKKDNTKRNKKIFGIKANNNLYYEGGTLIPFPVLFNGEQK